METTCREELCVHHHHDCAEAEGGPGFLPRWSAVDGGAGGGVTPALLVENNACRPAFRKDPQPSAGGAMPMPPRSRTGASVVQVHGGGGWGGSWGCGLKAPSSGLRPCGRRRLSHVVDREAVSRVGRVEWDERSAGRPGSVGLDTSGFGPNMRDENRSLPGLDEARRNEHSLLALGPTSPAGLGIRTYARCG